MLALISLILLVFQAHSLPTNLLGPSGFIAEDQLQTSSTKEIDDVCKCDLEEFFDEDVMVGYIKTLSDCTKEFTCIFIIKPKLDYVVTLTTNEVGNPYYYGSPNLNLHIFYYANSTEKEHLIYSKKYNKAYGVEQSPKNFGLYLVLNKTNPRVEKYRDDPEEESNEGSGQDDYFYGYKRRDVHSYEEIEEVKVDFSLKFARVRSSELKFSCPEPYLTATSVRQEINGEDFPEVGCAFRITAESSIRVETHCTGGILTQMMFRANSANQTDTVVSGTASPYHPFAQDLQSSAIDLFLMTKMPLPYIGYPYSLKDNNTCSLRYYALDYNPCNCSTTKYNLTLNIPMTLSSPGFRQFSCSFINCIYNLNIPKTAVTNESNTAFLINAYHRSQMSAIGIDMLTIFVDKLIPIGLDEIYNDRTNQFLAMRRNNPYHLQTDDIWINNAIGVGNVLDIGYTAGSTNANGFTMNITAIEIPTECLCPGGYMDIPLTNSSMFMKIPAHCPLVSCRFLIGNNIGQENAKMFRLALDHYLPQPGEYIDIDAGRVHHTHYEDFERHSNGVMSTMVDYATNSTKLNIKIHYVRSGNDITLEDSHFNFTWKWMTESDCRCGLSHLTASDKIDILYSPGFPHQYCSNMNCTYHIAAADGFHVELNVTFFETETYRDFLRIYEGAPGSNLTEVRKLSGFIKDHPLIRTGPNSTLIFTSDKSLSLSGFSIAFRAVANSEAQKTPTKFLFLIIFIIIALLAGVWIGSVFYQRRRRSIAPVESLENPAYSVYDVLTTTIDG